MLSEFLLSAKIIKTFYDLHAFSGPEKAVEVNHDSVNNIKEGKSSKIRIVACYRTSQQIFYMNLVWKSKSHKSLTNGEKSLKLCLHLSSKYTRNPFFSFEVKKYQSQKVRETLFTF